ncbi:MAG: hypothetical protein Q4C83_03215, partial [Candidatus Saccharibacteria bacterium]|nr:hypothetical protein [Candidatus Saccharibacteria bacterium]
HRTKVDNLVEKFEHSKYGQLIPTEILAGAASVAGWAAGAAARNRLVQAWSFGGGAVAAGFIAAAREGNMTATDRQTMARMLAEGDNDIKVDAKYNNRRSETMLKMAK